MTFFFDKINYFRYAMYCAKITKTSVQILVKIIFNKVRKKFSKPKASNIKYAA